MFSEFSSFYSKLFPEQKALFVSMSAVIPLVGFIQLSPSLLKIFKGIARRLLESGWRGGKSASHIKIGTIRLSDDARMRHTHIMGATGSGKTVLLEHLIYQDLARGYGTLIIDPKGERDLFERVKTFCKEIGRADDLHLLSSTYMSESARWNPCRLGDASELQSKFYNSAKYEHSYYAKATELTLLRAFESLTRDEPNELLLSDLVQKLDGLSQGGRDENIKGLYFDIQNLAFGEWAPILGTKTKPGNQIEISVLDIVRKNEILFVDLPTEGKSVQSARIGSLLLQEMTLISGLRKRLPQLRSERPFSIYVDEFDAFATDPFVTFLNKGRSSGFMIHMAHQTLADLTKVSPTFQGQIMGNPNIRFVFRMDLAEDAEKIARQFGTRLAIKRTHQTKDGAATGMSSMNEVQEFRTHPDTIKELGIGECIVSIKTDRYLELVKIPPLARREAPRGLRPTQREKISSRSIVPCASSGTLISGEAAYTRVPDQKEVNS